ncbi:MAG TPA: tRNA pseudouridine(55) synthase TruB [Gaiellaceae bacterium]|jgi:tRNA pseudouridine55 synthase|nr:tRNA pseudouridine(55) synthase TruB [Gaiellaceae bacterium]
MPPRALEPAGIVLADKPAGPTSHDLVAALRRRTGARTGHAGTLDPFATGLLLLLSGSTTKLSGSFTGLDKRYVTEVDLTARTSTGDPEGDVVERSQPPEPGELERLLAGLRGEVALPVPSASAVKIGGERAYRLHRRGVAVELPVRRTTIYELRLDRFDGEVAALELHVSSGTYVRSLAEALGGHCRSLRRTTIGPFSVEEADWERIVPADEALARLQAWRMPASPLSEPPGRGARERGAEAS